MITDNILVDPLSEHNGVIVEVPEMLLNYKKGDTVFFEAEFVQSYKFFGQPYFIIPCRRVIAKL